MSWNFRATRCRPWPCTTRAVPGDQTGRSHENPGLYLQDLNYKKNIDSLFTAKVVAKASMVAKIRMGMLEQRSASIQ
jgi:hypothetical protein